jgi:hypothetical protein
MRFLLASGSRGKTSRSTLFYGIFFSVYRSVLLKRNVKCVQELHDIQNHITLLKPHKYKKTPLRRHQRPLGEGTQKLTAATTVWAPPNRLGRPYKKDFGNNSEQTGYSENPRKNIYYKN